MTTDVTIPADLDTLDWHERETAAEALVPLLGQLFRQFGVVPAVYGRSLVNASSRKIIKLHRYARHLDGRDLPLGRTREIVEILLRLTLSPATVDLAELSRRWEQGSGSLEDHVREQVGSILTPRGEPVTTDVVLYGFGRIGRLLARLMIENEAAPGGLRLKAVVVRAGGPDDLVKRASLLRRDTVHGAFDGTITVDEATSSIVANGTKILVINASDPASVDYTAYGIEHALLVDNTGRWRDAAGLGQHLACPGIAKVLLTAPGKGDIKNVVYGVNQDMISADDSIVSAASCTTNAITPVLKAIDDEFGVVHGHVETVHSFTNDQNLTDNYHTGNRRGRSASLNLVIAETGAAKAVAKALPQLAGRLTGSSIRVPTPNVSLAILHLTLATGTDRNRLNAYLRTTALRSELRRQIAYTDSPEVVSSDFVGSRHTGTVDGLATIADDTHAVVYVWYDNEFGYSCQVHRVMDHFADTQRPSLPLASPALAPA